jgi:putative DNA primase/helicase
MINALMSCLGDYRKTINQSTVEERNNANSGGPSEDLARLKSARFVNVPEPKEGLRMDEAKVKNMTGRDIITARFLHQNSFEFSPQFVLWIDTNHAPVIKDLTLFESRRIRIIPFDRHFSDEEQDQDLKDEFARPEALSGIFNWILSGLWLYHEIGLSEPLAVKEAIKKYRQENDKIGQFVEEYFETAGPNDAIRTKDAYERYRRWCSDNGYKTESIKKFSGKISSAGYVIKVGRYQGSIQLSHIWGIKISSH